MTYDSVDEICSFAFWRHTHENCYATLYNADLRPDQTSDVMQLVKCKVAADNMKEAVQTCQAFQNKCFVTLLQFAFFGGTSKETVQVTLATQ